MPSLLTRAKPKSKWEAEANRYLAIVAQGEKCVRELEAKLAAHRTAKEAQHAEYTAWQGRTAERIPFSRYPSEAEGRARDRADHQIPSDLDAARRQMQLDRERLCEAELKAKPLSEAAQRRLRELVIATQADRELQERGFNLTALRNDPEVLLQVARDYGIVA